MSPAYADTIATHSTKHAFHLYNSSLYTANAEGARCLAPRRCLNQSA